MQRVLSEARAELDFHHFVIFGDVNIYFFSLNTQVDAHVVLNPQRLSCSCVKYMAFYFHGLRTSFVLQKHKSCV